MPYRSSPVRVTKQQELYDQLNDDIVDVIRSLTESDAETLWFAMRAEGRPLSQSTFNNRLKRLVASGLVIKTAVGYKKYLYQPAPPKP